ncbi:MAG: alpha/beta fold hydrolase [Anaeromyxobacteraceae bacterium]
MNLAHVVRPPAAPSERPPLAILVHGLGADEHDLFGLAPFLDPRLTVVSVRAPREAVPMGYSWFEIDWSESPPRVDVGHVAESRDLLVRFAIEVSAALGTDPARTWLVGFSQGASMAAACAVFRPDLFRGIVAHSGRVPRRLLPAPPVPALEGFPVLWQHGTADPVVPVAFGREARDALGELGMAVDYAEYPIGHEISEQGLLDMTGWLSTRIDESGAA